LVLAARAEDRATARDGVPHLVAVRTTQGRRLPAALLVACTGIRARDELAAAAGLDTLPRGGIVVDAQGRRPADPDICAIGDCAAPRGARPSGLIGPGWEQAGAAALALRADAGVPAPVERDAAGRPVRTPLSPAGRLDPIVVKS